MQAAEIASLLRIGSEEARVVAEPLALPELGTLVAQQRDRVVTILDEAYPPLLREIDPPPAVLFVAGDPGALSRPTLAIVGSRRATPYGINVARRLARELAGSGFTIASGFARGIDAAAHDEAILAGGTTVAVLGTGIEIDYPRGQKALRRRIEQNGAVVTEFAPATAPHAMNFPIRNRIISGLALGTIVVEATERSGSLITARLACEQGREVFAVPGSIFSPASAGTNRLIQSGAKLVRGIDDISEELGAFFASVPRQRVEAPRSESEQRVMAALEYESGLHIDTLASELRMAHSTLSEALLQLELTGAIRALPGQRYVKAG